MWSMTHPSARQLLRLVRGGGAPRRPDDDVERAHGVDFRAEQVATTPRAALLDDIEILAALRDGDPNAATALYRRTRPQVERTVRRLLGVGDADHDDVVQVAMISIVESVHRFRGESSLDTWVGRVTANTVFKAIRQRGSQRRTVERTHEHHVVATERGAGFGESVETRDLVARVRDILSTMDPAKSYTILLHDVCGYDLREVASITEASVAAAQSRLVRGRAELHELIERDPELAELLARTEAR